MMKIDVRSLQFDHVVVYRTRSTKENWQEGIHFLEELELERNIYKNGPVFFSFEQDTDKADFGEFTYYMPINTDIEIEQGTEIEYIDTFSLEQALVYRQADQELDFTSAIQKIRDYSKEEKIEIDDRYFCVLLPVYGDMMIDLYVPIGGEVA